MCLILLAWRARADYPLVLCANRDEYFARPSQAAGWWHDHPDILAGRDLLQGGTWLGMHRDGRFAAVTNFRNGKQDRPATPSRGILVAEYLAGNIPASEFIRQLPAVHNPYNLLLGDQRQLIHYNNITGICQELRPGIHGLSNHLLDTPWPKLRDGCRALRECLGQDGPIPDEDLFELLRDERTAKDDELPDTGIGLERERLLSSRFISSPEYGTRCSTVITIDSHQRVHFCERPFDREGRSGVQVIQDFDLKEH